MKKKIATIITFSIILVSSMFIVYAKEGEVINIAPTTGISLNKNKNLDFEILTNYTGTKYIDLQNKLIALKSDLLSLNIDLNFNIINDGENIATKSKTVTDTKDGSYTASNPYGSFSDTYSYNDGTYSGTLYRSGAMTLSSSTSQKVVSEYRTGTRDCYRNLGVWDTMPNSIDYSSPYWGTIYSQGYTEYSSPCAYRVYTYAGYRYSYQDVTTTTYYQNYTGTVSGSYNTTYNICGLNFDKALNADLRSGTNKYLIIASNSTNISNFDTNFENYYPLGNLSQSTKDSLVNNDFDIYIAADPGVFSANINSITGKQELAINDFTDKNKIYDIKDIDTLFQDIATNNVEVDTSKEYVCTDETLNYNLTYDDYDNDTKVDERYRYNQVDTMFENSTGYISNNNEFSKTPITQFNKVGKYIITYQAQDDPTERLEQSGYKKWSTEENQLEIIVHRRPIPKFSVHLNSTNLTITDESFDYDHLSTSNKGIAKEEWRWKKDTDTDFKNEYPPTTGLQAGTTYIVEQRVQDLEGAWSSWYSVSFKVGQNNPPLANFIIVKDVMMTGETNNITDKSYDPDSDTIAEWDWQLTNKDTNITQDLKGTKPTLSTLAKGNYTLSLKVRDNPKIAPTMWSDVYSKDFQIIDNLTVTATLSPTPAKQGQRITFDIKTEGYAKFLTIYLPNELKTIDTNNVAGTVFQQIPEQKENETMMYYYLPISTPTTLNSTGNNIRAPYVFTVRAEKADGTYKLVYLNLDVKGNIYGGIKTEMK